MELRRERLQGAIMKRYRDAYKNTPAHVVVTFTAYSLRSVLGLCRAGCAIAGVTTAKYHGLMLCGRDDARKGVYAYMMEGQS